MVRNIVMFKANSEQVSFLLTLELLVFSAQIHQSGKNTYIRQIPSISNRPEEIVVQIPLQLIRLLVQEDLPRDFKSLIM
jgi:hypothetical protein